jgi:hypothetical protein
VAEDKASVEKAAPWFDQKKKNQSSSDDCHTRNFEVNWTSGGLKNAQESLKHIIGVLEIVVITHVGNHYKIQNFLEHWHSSSPFILMPKL